MTYEVTKKQILELQNCKHERDDPALAYCTECINHMNYLLWQVPTNRIGLEESRKKRPDLFKFCR